MKTLHTAICDHERGLCNHWNLLDRIAELEAELTMVRDAAKMHQARAEKAEAEVERLKGHLWHGHIPTVCDLPDCRRDEP